MDNKEFLLHMKIIKDMLAKPNIRIILLHNPYNESQQRIIDAISRESTKIIGQVVRVPPIQEKAKEIQRLILAHKDPGISCDKLRYVILGQQTPKAHN